MLRFSCAAAALLVTAAFAADSHVSNFHQLTHGGQNAEAYWAPDGKRLIFQSTRPPNECDQMYIMNADGSDQHMVSTGKGRTGFQTPLATLHAFNGWDDVFLTTPADGLQDIYTYAQ